MAVSINERFLDFQVAQAIRLVRVGNEQARVVRGILSSVDKKLARKLTDHWAEGAPFSAARLRALRKQIEDLLAVMHDKELAPAVRTIAKDTAKATAAIEEKLFKRILPAGLDVTTPNPGLLNTIAETRPFNGAQLGDWIEDLKAGDLKRTWRRIQEGLIAGDPTPDIIRSVVGSAALKYKDGVREVSKRGAEALVRTSINHAAMQGRQAMFEENEDLISSVRWVSTLDMKTTPICRERDGKTFPVKDGPRPPAHPNCRSTAIPVVKSWKELGFDMDELPPGTRSSMDGYVPADLTYWQWFDRQSASVQEDILGPTRFKMWKNGEVTVDQFVNDHGKTLTIPELRQLADNDIGGRAPSIASARVSPGNTKDWVYVDLKDLEGAKIGELEATIDKGGDTLQIREIKVSESLRGAGHGKSLYRAIFDYADEHNLAVRSDNATSISADRAWASLAREDSRIKRAANVELDEANGKYYAVRFETYGDREVALRTGEPVWYRARLEENKRNTLFTHDGDDYVANLVPHVDPFRGAFSAEKVFSHDADSYASFRERLLDLNLVSTVDRVVDASKLRTFQTTVLRAAKIGDDLPELIDIGDGFFYVKDGNHRINKLLGEGATEIRATVKTFGAVQKREKVLEWRAKLDEEQGPGGLLSFGRALTREQLASFDPVDFGLDDWPDLSKLTDDEWYFVRGKFGPAVRWMGEPGPEAAHYLNEFRGYLELGEKARPTMHWPSSATAMAKRQVEERMIIARANLPEWMLRAIGYHSEYHPGAEVRKSQRAFARIEGGIVIDLDSSWSTIVHEMFHELDHALSEADEGGLTLTWISGGVDGRYDEKLVGLASKVKREFLERDGKGKGRFTNGDGDYALGNWRKNYEARLYEQNKEGVSSEYITVNAQYYLEARANGPQAFAAERATMRETSPAMLDLLDYIFEKGGWAFD